uniref:Fibronectin type-III domain-containing protein n=1 Tax=Callorhinchus milii TaxID=7868 RepID=A0A4W3K1X0_CALMI|eukprot:gi/632966293/ref/XP_007899334.1/ PREDICTED: interleukin-27 subunit beta [Callorhinchus milii]
MNERLIFILGTLLVPLSSSNDTQEQSATDGVTTRYGQIGTNVTLVCSCADRDVVEWRLNDSKVIETDATHLTGTSLTLTIATLPMGGLYSCHSQDSGKTCNRLHLILGYPPGKPQVTCWSASYPLNVICSWKLENETYLPTEISATYRYGIGETKECSRNATGDNSCIITNMSLFSHSPYTVTVTAVNPLGIRSAIKSFLLEKIIKPDPPMDVTVSPIPNEPKKLLLRWKPPVTWPNPEVFVLTYIVHFRQEGSRRERVTEVDDQTSYTLNGLRSKALYFVKVAARDVLNNGEPSAWSSTKSARLWSS